MGTFTAQILVGQKHSYDGGILNISHILYLSENSRPAWILTPSDIFNENQLTQSRITWIPTLENMLEDALLMIGLYVLKNEDLVSLANQAFKKPKSDFIELYDDIKIADLQNLYKLARQIEGSHKIMLSVFKGSSIINQLPILKTYQNDVEICTSVYTKEYSLWSKQVESFGEL